MLVLSRRIGEKIIIGPDGPDQITVMIADIYKGNVRVAIGAPKGTDIWREEIYLRMQEEKKNAS